MSKHEFSIKIKCDEENNSIESINENKVIIDISFEYETDEQR